MYVVIALESLNINSLLFAFDINLYYFIFMYWVFFVVKPLCRLDRGTR